MSEKTTPVKHNGYYTVKSLAAIYELHERTLRRRLQTIQEQIEAKAKKSVITKKIGKKKKKIASSWGYFNYDQLKIIVEYLGEPLNYTFDGKKFIPEQ